MGKTNILRHKSWHVGKRENIERVRRDEEAARLKEEQTRSRQLEVERERRYTQLRSNIDAPPTATGPVAPRSGFDETQLHQGHVHLFVEEEMASKRDHRNAERMAEERAEKEKEERRMTMYLDEGVQQPRPWYDRLEDNVSSNLKAAKEEGKRTFKRHDEEAIKRKQDPLTLMRSYQQKMEERERRSVGSYPSTQSLSQVSSSFQNKNASVQQLREERLQREAEERQRLAQLMAASKYADSATAQRVYAVVKETLPEEPSSGNKQRYHTQFNPDIMNHLDERKQQRHHRSYGSYKPY